MSFELATNEGGTTVVTVSGELDISNVVELESAVEPIIERKPDHLVVDVRDLRFADSSAICRLGSVGGGGRGDRTAASISASAAGDHEDGVD